MPCLKTITSPRVFSMLFCCCVRFISKVYSSQQRVTSFKSTDHHRFRKTVFSKILPCLHKEHWVVSKTCNVCKDLHFLGIFFNLANTAMIYHIHLCFFGVMLKPCVLRAAINGANYLDRDTRLLYITIRGPDPVDVKTVPLVVLKFGLPPITIDDFFEENLIQNLAT